MLRCNIIRCGRPRNCARLVLGIGQRTRGALRSGPRIRDSHYIITISLYPWYPALRWPNADETGLKHLPGAADRMVDLEDATIFSKEIRVYFTFARVCARIRERVAIIAAQMYVYVYKRARAFVGPVRKGFTNVSWRIVPLRHTALSGYVWKRMNKGEMNLLSSQAIGRRPDRRINSF